MSTYSLIDTHCHLVEDAFKTDIEKVYQRAIQHNVHGVVVLSEEFSEFAKVLALKTKYPQWVNPGFGIHPVQDLDNFQESVVKHAEQLVCIGEKINKVPSKTAFYPHPPSPLQGAFKVQMHAFDGRPGQAMVGVERGYFFSIPPCVLRSRQKQELVKAIPLDHLLLETDSPMLGVDPKARNEPAGVTHVVQYIAKTKNVDIEMVRKITTENALKLYSSLALDKK